VGWCRGPTGPQIFLNVLIVLVQVETGGRGYCQTRPLRKVRGKRCGNAHGGAWWSRWGRFAAFQWPTAVLQVQLRCPMQNADLPVHGWLPSQSWKLPESALFQTPPAPPSKPRCQFICKYHSSRPFDRRRPHPTAHAPWPPARIPTICLAPWHLPCPQSKFVRKFGSRAVLWPSPLTCLSIGVGCDSFQCCRCYRCTTPTVLSSPHPTNRILSSTLPPQYNMLRLRQCFFCKFSIIERVAAMK
jgi:hypothetical protein